MKFLGLSYNDVVVESERLARIHNNTDMRIGKSTLGNIVSGSIRQPGTAKLDSLRNIIDNPSIGLLFLVPGVNETLRVNGRAMVTQDAAMRAPFEAEGIKCRTVVAVEVDEAFIQCAKALVRADVWNPAKHVVRSKLPTLGEILAAHTNGHVDAVEYDLQAAQKMKESL